MLLAKIDAEGNVVEFPYYDGQSELGAQELPEGVVQVNKSKNHPSLSWNELATTSSITLEGDEWVVNYEVVSRFSDDEEAKQYVKNQIQYQSSRIEAKFNNSIDLLNQEYNVREMQTWAQQIVEARNYIIDPTDETSVPLITAIASERGISIGDLAKKIVAKNDDYNTRYGYYLAQYSNNKKILAEISADDSSTWDKLNEIR